MRIAPLTPIPYGGGWVLLRCILSDLQLMSSEVVNCRTVVLCIAHYMRNSIGNYLWNDIDIVLEVGLDPEWVRNMQRRFNDTLLARLKIIASY